MRKVIIFLLFFSFAGVPFGSVSADVGPKPSMEFRFYQGLDGLQLTILDGVQYECSEPDCSDARLLEDFGPQGFRCSPEENTCSSMAYGYSEYNRIEVTFSDGKIRHSNVFRTDNFHNIYRVTVRDDDLLVEPLLSTPYFIPPPLLFLCLGCLGFVGILVACIFLWVRLIRKR